MTSRYFVRLIQSYLFYSFTISLQITALEGHLGERCMHSTRRYTEYIVFTSFAVARPEPCDPQPVEFVQNFLVGNLGEKHAIVSSNFLSAIVVPSFAVDTLK